MTQNLPLSETEHIWAPPWRTVWTCIQLYKELFLKGFQWTYGVTLVPGEFYFILPPSCRGRVSRPDLFSRSLYILVHGILVPCKQKCLFLIVCVREWMNDHVDRVCFVILKQLDSRQCWCYWEFKTLTQETFENKSSTFKNRIKCQTLIVSLVILTWRVCLVPFVMRAGRSRMERLVSCSVYIIYWFAGN